MTSDINGMEILHDDFIHQQNSGGVLPWTEKDLQFQRQFVMKAGWQHKCDFWFDGQKI